MNRYEQIRTDTNRVRKGYERNMDTPKEVRFTIRMNAELHQWLKQFALGTNNSMSQLVIEYVENLRNPKPVADASPSEQPSEHTDTEFQMLSYQLKSNENEINRLYEQLTHKDEQLDSTLQSLDQSQQLLAVQTKMSETLTDQLGTSQLMLSDMRKRPVGWKRVFRWT